MILATPISKILVLLSFNRKDVFTGSSEVIVKGIRGTNPYSRHAAAYTGAHTKFLIETQGARGAQAILDMRLPQLTYMYTEKFVPTHYTI